jgi:putative copper export protein/methionine-rich copper-binding protein CopC
MDGSAMRGLRALLLLVLLATLLPPSAEAHQRLLATEPARDAAAGAVPRELRLTFYEPVELTFTRVELFGPDGEAVALGTPRLDSPESLVVPVTGALRAGVYTVRWATASRDGHPVRSDFRFSIAADAEGLTAAPRGEHAGAVAAPGQAPPPGAHHPAPSAPGASFDADSPAYVAVRWITFIALLGVIGAVAFALPVLTLLARDALPARGVLVAESRRRAAALGLAFAALLALAALARLYAQSLAMHGADGALDAERLGAMVTRTVWGWGWMLQGGGALIAAAGFALARRGAAAGWGLAAIATLALAPSAGLSGHAAAMTGTTGTLALVADALHVLAAGGWIGGLLVLLAAGIPAALRMGPGGRGPAVAALVRAFSPTALAFAAVLVLSGTYAAVVHVGSVDALLGSRYGNVLLVKLGIFVLVFATGAYNYLRVRPALGDDAGTARLQRSATAEIAVGAAVLLVTAVLVATSPPDREAHGGEPVSGAAAGERGGP